MRVLHPWPIFVLLTVWSICCAPAHAHESLPASLMLQEVDAQVFAVRWRVPQTQGPAPDIMPRFSDDCQQSRQPLLQAAVGARLLVWTLHCRTGLRQGASITFDGLPWTLIDVVVRVSYLDGTVKSHIASLRQPVVRLDSPQGPPVATAGYFELGVAHILGGVDHLLFVLCLILLVPNVSGLFKTITAFTVAHSLTLALAALEWVRLPQPPVEATIALSILFLARELARTDGTPGIALRRPWAVAWVFGLLHGFGFASALAEVGLPQGDIPLALLLFNVGVEAGQIAFVFAVYPVVRLARRWRQAVPAWARSLPVYVVGSVAGFWWLQRMATLLRIV